jgi:hypothetical protein
MLVNTGRDHQAGSIGGDIVGFAGTATASSATSLTTSGLTSGIYVGHIVVAGSTAANFVYGIIISNTTTNITVDAWSVPATPGGAAGATPAATAPFIILPGQAPAWFTGLTANTGAAAGTDTVLTGEITTAGGGLIRKISAYAHTAGVASYTLTTAYTANGSDTLPVTIHKIGVFQSLTGATRMAFETVLNADATLNISGDQLTVTQTVTLS